MKRDYAQRIAEATQQAQAALEAAIEGLRAKGAAQVADACHFELTRVWVQVGFHILAPLWKEFPDLGPLGQDATNHTQMSRLRISATELAPVREALAQLQRVMQEAIPLFEAGASTPGEETGYLSALATIRDSIGQADSAMAMMATQPGERGRAS